MNGFWIAIAILLVAPGFVRTADCALKVPGACERAAEQYAPKPPAPKPQPKTEN